MRNALYSTVSSQPYNFGNNEVQMPNWDVSMLQVDSIVTNIHRNGFSVDSRSYKDDNQLRDGGFSVSCQPLIDYQQGFQFISTSFDNVSQQSPMLTRKRSLPQFEVDFQSLQNGLLPQEGISDLVSDNTSLNVCKKINKKKKGNTSCEEQWHHHQVINASTEQKLQVPVRRSQKLSDKITALQKLVSPYGKTDTASVLQEASLYIKLLQEQIQNLFQMLSSSYSSARVLHSQEITEEEIDLRSIGLCLVPISYTQKANAASGMAVHDDCKLKFLELKAKRTYRFIVYKIEEKQKQVIVEKLGEPTDSYENFTASLPADECRYAVYDFDFVTEENCQKSKIVFIAWSPDTSKVRSKMIYASSKDRFKRELDGIQIELQATDPTEMGLDVIRSRSN
ncbi:hypothetical protein Pint_06245 [Pistacia integerrima]|uniref:Uncharacterized protein n=1 Tax=Pistacia integerrima TaxID=434235 RepID=A0ACC0Z316_9ROSI|nr:hypothetical protein Pint_06245 [Pistacia integerrima]